MENDRPKQSQTDKNENNLMEIGIQNWEIVLRDKVGWK